MKVLHIAVCDDEPEILEAFTYLIEECFSYHNIRVKINKFSNPIQLANAMQKTNYDLLFLDIDMPQVDGITFAKKLRETGNDVNIIYVSNKEELVYKVFDVQPYSFIRKNRFFEEIAGVVRSYVKSSKDADTRRLLIQNRGDILTLDLNKTMYFEGAGKTQKMFLFMDKEPTIIKSSMKELEDLLCDKGFIRVHRGFLVNYQYIESIKNNNVILTNGYNIPISRRSVNEVKDKFLNLMKWNGSTFF